MHVFYISQRVATPKGAGTVAYQRTRPPDYTVADAVSVVLDSERQRPGYNGTMFQAADVTHERPDKRATCAHDHVSIDPEGMGSYCHDCDSRI
jgi:hypothetical protein